MPIFDQGYQHWKGPLAGHAWRWLAVTRHGVRTQLKGRIVRLLLLVAWLPAIALIVMLALWGLLEQKVGSVLAFFGQLLPAGVLAEPKDYRSAIWTIAYSYFFKAELACSVFLILAVGPNLISRDLRFNALPLYFSRPLRRLDYFAGKLGVIGFFLAATVVVPALTAYLLGIAFSLDLGVLRDTYWLVWASLLYGLVIIVSAGTLVLALSSLSRRTIYVGITWIGFWFLTAMFSSILIGVRGDTTRRQITLERITPWLEANPPPPGIEMSGPYPIIRNSALYRPARSGDPKASAEEEQRRWYQAWWEAYAQCQAEAEAIELEEKRGDWRPVCSYQTNLERIGEQLLSTDAAWLTIGRAVERPRAALGPVLGRPARGLVGPRADRLSQPANDRLLADRMAWQFPWYWSAGVLTGLMVLSVWLLTWQVESLDRLK